MRPRAPRSTAPLGAALVGLALAGAACGHVAAPAPCPAGGPASAPASQRSDETPIAISPAQRALELAFLRRVLEESYAHLELKRRQWGVDLDDLVRRYGPRLGAVATWEEYDALMLRLVAEMHDSHVSYNRPRSGGAAGRHQHVRYGVGLRTAWIEQQLIVTEVEPGGSAAAAGLVPGDRILAIRGQAAEAWLARGLNRRPWSRPEAGMVDEAQLVTPLVLEAEDEPRPLVLVLEARGGGAGVAMRAVRLPLVRVEPRPRTPVALTWEGDVAVLALRSFERGEPPTLRAIAAAFAEVRGRARGLVLDLRQNRGGIDEIARSVAGHLVTRPTVVGSFRVRLSARALAERPSWRALAAGPDGFSAPVPMTAQPEGPDGFAGPVVALVDIGCRSACETLAAGLKGTGLATLVGERTAGTSGAPIKVRLPHSGASVGVPTWASVGPDGQPIEGVGVSPDVLVAPTRAAAAAGRDLARERAVTLVRARLAGRRPAR